MIGSILGIEEGDNAVANVAQKFMKLLLSVESVPLVEGGIVVTDVLKYFLVEVTAQWGNHIDCTSDNSKRFKYLSHLTYSLIL